MLKLIFNKIKQLNKMSFLIVPLLAIQLAIPTNFAANAINGSAQDFQIIKFEPAYNPPNYVTYNLGDTVNFAITVKNITNSNKTLELQGLGFKCDPEIPQGEYCGADLRYDSGIKNYNFSAKETKTISYSFVPNQVGYWQIDALDPPWNPGVDVAIGSIIKVIGNPQIGIEKTARNITDGGNFSDYTKAKIGDELEFKLAINSIGNVPIQNAITWDKLPNGLDYIENSTTIDNQSVSDGIIGSGIPTGLININIVKNIKFRAEVSDEFYSNSTTLTNYGYAKIEGKSNYVYDTAIIKVIKEPTTSSLIIEKYARGEDEYSFSKLAHVDNGEEIEFLIKVKAQGNTPAKNVKIWDKLPLKLSYIENSTEINGEPTSDDSIISDGIIIDEIEVGQTVKITFRAEAQSTYTTTVTNYAYAKIGSQTKTYSDYAKVSITNSPTNTHLIFTKLAKGENDFSFSKLANAKNGEEVQFLITIQNDGDKDIENLKVWDKLPSKLSYINGSTRVDGDYIDDDSIVSDGINIDKIQINETIDITFRAEVVNYNCSIPETVTNYAYGKISGETKNYSDYAKVQIVKCSTPQNGELSISKLGRNYSKNGAIWVENVSAKPGDVIEFSIQIRNTKNSAITNVYAYDILPDKMTYISNSTSIDNQLANDDLIDGDRLFLGTLSAYQTKTIKFKAKLFGSEYFPAHYTTTITNNAYAYGNDANQVSDTANVSVFYAPYIPPTPTSTPIILGATDVKTGPEDSIIFISILSFILTCGLFFASKKMRQAGLISALKLKALIMKVKIAETLKF